MNDLFPQEPLAILSEDRVYRYFLSRQWGISGKKIAFIGLNPSTADAENDDPTIRRCIAFAKAFGGTSLSMVNLFAHRATNPSELLIAKDPVGPDNDYWLEKTILSSDLVIAAWGNHGSLLDRNKLIENKYSNYLYALAITKQGMPGHPLYLRSEVTPVRYYSQNTTTQYSQKE
ncbi:DUF1643 domain-containing protein [Pseudomonas sp. C1C7]|uniref:DUF1643 domain-containing protein n=1 Tax=Pseudomonas sp. C1C7 TaxID=2735272 RepID=UPI00158652DB|nr:DUF1643 domain-containing protein [Pseudomonas sp. C1C7]NUT75044.1 DUF1643 domain-containing protein [Pseudomonas sp. C1C7]